MHSQYQSSQQIKVGRSCSGGMAAWFRPAANPKICCETRHGEARQIQPDTLPSFCVYSIRKATRQRIDRRADIVVGVEKTRPCEIAASLDRNPRKATPRAHSVP